MSKLIENRFEKDEKKELDKIENDFNKPIEFKKEDFNIYKNLNYGIHQEDSSQSDKRRRKTNGQLRYRLNLYIKKIMELMRKYKLGSTDRKYEEGL